jgi:hypothetical protein
VIYFIDFFILEANVCCFSFLLHLFSPIISFLSCRRLNNRANLSISHYLAGFGLQQIHRSFEDSNGLFLVQDPGVSGFVLARHHRIDIVSWMQDLVTEVGGSSVDELLKQWTDDSGLSHVTFDGDVPVSFHWRVIVHLYCQQNAYFILRPAYAPSLVFAITQGVSSSETLISVPRFVSRQVQLDASLHTPFPLKVASKDRVSVLCSSLQCGDQDRCIDKFAEGDYTPWCLSFGKQHNIPITRNSSAPKIAYLPESRRVLAIEKALRLKTEWHWPLECGNGVHCRLEDLPLVAESLAFDRTITGFGRRC